MRDRFSSLVSVVVCAVVALSLFSGCSRHPSKKELPPPSVTVTNPVQKEITRYLEYTGNIAALETVDIRARVAGFLQEIKFTPRQKVKTGDLLFVIDPRQYQAQVKEATGKVAAQKASNKLAQTELQMAQQLESKEAISGLRLEKSVAQRDASIADVELAEAELDKARLYLEWTQVTSPIDGRVDRNLVDIGNLVGATEKTKLTSVVNDDLVYVYFNITELDLLPLLRGHLKEFGQSTPSDNQIPVFLALADEKDYPHEGTIDFAATTVDQNTGTVQTRGIFPNPDGLLMAGMFARVRVPIDKRMAILIPEIAVQFDQGGRYVLVVDDDNVVQHRRIKTSRYAQNQWIADEGLTPKDRVIVSGLQRARAGSKVKPTLAPADGGRTDPERPAESRGK